MWGLRVHSRLLHAPGTAAAAANAVAAERTLSASEAVTRTGSDIASDAALAHCAPNRAAAALGTSVPDVAATPAPARTCTHSQMLPNAFQQLANVPFVATALLPLLFDFNVKTISIAHLPLPAWRAIIAPVKTKAML